MNCAGVCLSDGVRAWRHSREILLQAEAIVSRLLIGHLSCFREERRYRFGMEGRRYTVGGHDLMLVICNISFVFLYSFIFFLSSSVLRSDLCTMSVRIYLE